MKHKFEVSAQILVINKVVTGTNKEVFDPNKLNNKEYVLASEGSEVSSKITNNGKPFTNVR